MNIDAIENPESADEQRRPDERRGAAGLIGFFGCFYFVQGFCEPTQGLLSQPLQSLLKTWQWQPDQAGVFLGLLSAPWWFKPLFGAISDYAPIRGYRRKIYLVAATALVAIGYFAADAGVQGAEHARLLFGLLLLASIGVAFSDVAIDALMVETAQPRGLTGRIQSIQWGAIYGAGILAAALGGYLSQRHRERWCFAIGGCLALGALALSVWGAAERRQRGATAGDWRAALRTFASALATPGVAPVGAFLFLWHFNPFSSAVLYRYLTDTLGVEESLYGNAESAGSASAMCGCLAYGLYCRSIDARWLIHLSIALGVLSTLAYLLLAGPRSAVALSVTNSLMTATATMIQLDLAARICPLSSAGTVFAALMAVSNIGMSLSTIVGGYLYSAWREQWGDSTAFDALVVVGAASTALCWLLGPSLRRAIDFHLPATSSCNATPK